MRYGLFFFREERFQRRDAHGDTEEFHGGGQLKDVGEGRCDADRGILRVDAVGEGRAGAGEGQAGVLAQGNGALGGAGQAAEAVRERL